VAALCSISSGLPIAPAIREINLTWLSFREDVFSHFQSFFLFSNSLNGVLSVRLYTQGRSVGIFVHASSDSSFIGALALLTFFERSLRNIINSGGCLGRFPELLLVLGVVLLGVVCCRFPTPLFGFRSRKENVNPFLGGFVIGRTFLRANA
jgi:hypothetical protein